MMFIYPLLFLSAADEEADGACVYEAEIFSMMEDCYGDDNDFANMRINWIREHWWAFGMCDDLALEINKGRDDVNGCRKYFADAKKAYDDENPKPHSTDPPRPPRTTTSAPDPNRECWENSDCRIYDTNEGRSWCVFLNFDKGTCTEPYHSTDPPLTTTSAPYTSSSAPMTTTSAPNHCTTNSDCARFDTSAGSARCFIEGGKGTCWVPGNSAQTPCPPIPPISAPNTPAPNYSCQFNEDCRRFDTSEGRAWCVKGRRKWTCKVLDHSIRPTLTTTSAPFTPAPNRFAKRDYGQACATPFMNIETGTVCKLAAQALGLDYAYADTLRWGFPRCFYDDHYGRKQVYFNLSRRTNIHAGNNKHAAICYNTSVTVPSAHWTISAPDTTSKSPSGDNFISWVLDDACIKEAEIWNMMDNCYEESTTIFANVRLKWIRDNWWASGRCGDICSEINKGRDDVSGCSKFCADAKNAHDDQNPALVGLPDHSTLTAILDPDAICANEASKLDGLDCVGVDFPSALERINWIRDNLWAFGKCGDICHEVSKGVEDVFSCRRLCARAKNMYDGKN